MRTLTRREWLRRLGPSLVEVAGAFVGQLQREAIVVIDTARCIAYCGPECGACAGLCPPGAESALRMVRARPELDATRCTGCGRCVASCPTSPPALELIPLD